MAAASRIHRSSADLGPADEAVARGEFACRGGEPQQGEQLPVSIVHGVAHLRAGEGLVLLFEPGPAPPQTTPRPARSRRPDPAHTRERSRARRLPSDSTSRWTPLSSASCSPCRASSGLPPPSQPATTTCTGIAPVTALRAMPGAQENGTSEEVPSIHSHPSR